MIAELQGDNDGRGFSGCATWRREGQGAPLVPYADWALYTDTGRPRVLQNIGEVGA